MQDHRQARTITLLVVACSLAGVKMTCEDRDRRYHMPAIELDVDEDGSLTIPIETLFEPAGEI